MQSFGFGAMKAERYFQAVYRKFSWEIAAIKYRAIFRRSIGSLVGGLLPSRTAGSWAALAMKDLGGGGTGGDKGEGGGGRVIYQNRFIN